MEMFIYNEKLKHGVDKVLQTKNKIKEEFQFLSRSIKITNFKMKIGINQPNFFLGYFDLLDTVDVFIVLDNVLFGNKPKRINRNFIVNRNGELVPLTLSIKHNSKTSLINECTIIKDKNYSSHINIIKENYRVAPYYNEVISLVEEIYDFPSNILSEFNTNLIKKIFLLFLIKC